MAIQIITDLEESIGEKGVSEWVCVNVWVCLYKESKQVQQITYLIVMCLDTAHHRSPVFLLGNAFSTSLKAKD
jgi:hypothetical protein